MKRKGPRGLTPDERTLWNKVKSRATPLLNPPSTEGEQTPSPDLQQPAPASKIPKFDLGEKASPKPAPAPNPKPPIQMDKRTFGQLSRGKLKPEAKIDLHGMTMAQAHPRLIGFISDAHATGKRLVLVITGKGKDRDEGGPIPTPKGILKRNVPMWLQAPPLGPMVLEVKEAHIRHGGAGAYYVYLRRRR